jgi:hypothetical protein
MRLYKGLLFCFVLFYLYYVGSRNKLFYYMHCLYFKNKYEIVQRFVFSFVSILMVAGTNYFTTCTVFVLKTSTRFNKGL